MQGAQQQKPLLNMHNDKDITAVHQLSPLAEAWQPPLVQNTDISTCAPVSTLLPVWQLLPPSHVLTCSTRPPAAAPSAIQI